MKTEYSKLERIATVAELGNKDYSTVLPSGDTSPEYSNTCETVDTEFQVSESPQLLSDEALPNSGKLPEAVYREFRASAIPDRLTDLNISYLSGQQAVEILADVAVAQAQKQKSYTGAVVTRILDRYEFAAAGGWVTHGTTFDSEPLEAQRYSPVNASEFRLSEVPYFKPDKPRQAQSFKGFGAEPKVETIKYETSAKCPPLPILAKITWEFGLKIAQRNGLGSQYQSRPDYVIRQGEVDNGFWGWWRDNNGPIVCTEGFKKALCLIARGYAAIALRGVTCWHLKGDKSALHVGLAELATPGRKVYSCFDQDSKPKTIANVNKQIQDLGNVLTAEGCEVAVLDWLESEGKGIDDAIFNAGENGQE